MRLYICDTRQLSGLEQQAAELLPPRRRDYAARYAQLADQRRSLAAGLLLRLVLGVERDDQLRYNESGKPFLDGAEFSLTHGGAYALLAVDNRPIGIDIEPPRPVKPTVAARMFSPAEQAWLARAAEGSEQWQQRFFTIWTRKESLIKALGAALANHAAELDLCPINTAPRRIGEEERYFLTRRVEGHIWSVCAEQPVQPQLTAVGIDELLA